MVNQVEYQAELGVEAMRMQKDLDTVFNGGELGYQWDHSPYKQTFIDCVEAVKRRTPPPCDVDVIIRKEAVRRVNNRHNIE